MHREAAQYVHDLHNSLSYHWTPFVFLPLYEADSIDGDRCFLIFVFLRRYLNNVAATAKDRSSALAPLRVDVALGVIGRPELLFLDEPTVSVLPLRVSPASSAG